MAATAGRPRAAAADRAGARRPRSAGTRVARHGAGGVAPVSGSTTRGCRGLRCGSWGARGVRVGGGGQAEPEGRRARASRSSASWARSGVCAEPSAGADLALDPPADPLDHRPAVGGQVHEHAAPVDGVGAAGGEPGVDELVDDPGGGRRGERGVRGDLAHAAPAAPGEHQQHAPAVAADAFGSRSRAPMRRRPHGRPGRAARPGPSLSAPGRRPTPTPSTRWFRHDDRLYLLMPRKRRTSNARGGTNGLILSSGGLSA